MGTNIKLTRIWGVPIELSWTWFLVFGLVTWSLAIGYFPAEYPTLSPAVHLAAAVVTSVLFFGSVLLHELGHVYAALREGTIGGAALDVTDPEPLPDDHPLWSLPNAIITPHTANTPEMGRPLLAARVTENVRRFIAGEPLVGPVDPDLGY